MKPRVFDAEVNANQPTLVFWVSGADSAGSTVRLGGGPQEDGSFCLSSPVKRSTSRIHLHRGESDL